MSFLGIESVAVSVWCDNDNLWVKLADGRQLAVPLAYFPRLLHATPDQRAACELSGGGTGLHWPDLDEDISVQGLLLGRGDQTKHARQSSRVA
jgi:Biotin carboxylase